MYSLQDPYSLNQDLEQLYERIDEFFSYKFPKGQIVVESKIILPKEVFWASKEAKDIFDKLIPKLKSLHTDMYSFIECVYKYQNKKYGKNEIRILERKYKLYRRFRQLNNCFKHFESDELDYYEVKNLTDINTCTMYVFFHIKEKGQEELVYFKDIIILFMQLTKDFKLVTFKESSEEQK